MGLEVEPQVVCAGGWRWLQAGRLAATGSVRRHGCKGALLGGDNLYLPYLCLRGPAFTVSAEAEAICSWGICP